MTDLSMYRGDTKVVAIAVTNPDGSARDITGATVVMTAKHGYGDADAVAVFKLSATLTNPTTGGASISILPNQTSALPATTSVLVYDVELTEASGQVTTIQTGKLVVSTDVNQT